MTKNKNEKKLQGSRLKEVLRTNGKVLFQAVVEDGVTEKDLVDPSFYSLVGGRFVQSGFMAEVEATDDSNSFYFKGLVFDSGPTHAVVKEIIFVEFDKKKEKKPVKKKESDVSDEKEDSDKPDEDTDPSDADQGYKVMKQGQTWSVISPDGNVVKDGIKQKSTAQRELEEHLIVLGL